MNTLLHRATRAVALATATAVAATTAALVGAAPASAVTPAEDATGWLATELEGGLMHNPNFGGFDDYGLTIDTAFSIRAVGGNDAVVRQIRDAMAPNISTYAGFGAGATAKALVFAQVAGVDPTSYGGVNLVTATADRVSTTAPIAGRIEDPAGGTDFANVIGQAFAARGLTVAGAAKAASATTFLLKQQCASGYFRLNFTVDKTASDQGCVEGSSPADTDVTALTVVQLAALPQKDAAVSASIAKAVAWLKAAQQADGSFGGGPNTSAPNSNSTGLAGWALGTQGDCVAAGRAGAWVQKLQVRNPAAGTPLAGESGAIAYDQAALDVGKASGISDATEDQWRRATSQAAPALASALTAAAIGFTGPTGFQRAGESATLSVSGVGEGEGVCLSGPGITGALSLRSGGGNSPLKTSVVLPGVTSTPVFTVTTATGTKTVAVKVLGKAKLPIKLKKKKVRPGQRQLVKVSGLAAGEKVTVRIRDKKVAKGLATTAGTFKVRVRIKGELAKIGRAKVVVTGEFKDLRKGRAYFRVRR